MNAVAKTLTELSDYAGLSGMDVANVTEVSKATVSRWTTGKASPQPRTQLILSDLHYVANRLRDFYTPAEVRVWLYGRNDLLDGKSAMELINENRTEDVLAAIERLGALAYL
ncbi:hypothetical protein RM530_16740 [Algiphilus sp. W345]|uniref:Antitoxin Xre/MbcA/ParS-like toxin-binding domain-containing protein n=1 Tax=Banduia mediterranea TaxID=3075609 RepID=A0ABU2WM76_9GAMM|nr:hypothetical protein [Algiphilus sp. W345]MDT0498993.1 hypothetical protein [Algiphilus sp. W345]